MAVAVTMPVAVSVVAITVSIAIAIAIAIVAVAVAVAVAVPMTVAGLWLRFPIAARPAIASAISAIAIIVSAVVRPARCRNRGVGGGRYANGTRADGSAGCARAVTLVCRATGLR